MSLIRVVVGLSVQGAQRKPAGTNAAGGAHAMGPQYPKMNDRSPFTYGPASPAEVWRQSPEVETHVYLARFNSRPVSGNGLPGVRRQGATAEGFEEGEAGGRRRAQASKRSRRARRGRLAPAPLPVCCQSSLSTSPTWNRPAGPDGCGGWIQDASSHSRSPSSSSGLSVPSGTPPIMTRSPSESLVVP